jgi:hypothetical protein
LKFQGLFFAKHMKKDSNRLYIHLCNCLIHRTMFIFLYVGDIYIVLSKKHFFFEIALRDPLEPTLIGNVSKGPVLSRKAPLKRT